jgi:signal transduction histidine kinase
LYLPSGANRCKVALKGSDNAITLAVEDKGAGFDPAEVRDKPGLGLSSMRERVQLVGGHFTVNTEPGRGTSIHVSIPLKRAEK